MQQKVILVSGGSKGLGQGFVQYLLEEGHFVYTFSRGSTPFVESLQKGKFAEFFCWKAIDATDSPTIIAYVKSIYQKHKRIDALVNNSGVGIDGVLPTLTSAQISKIISVNLDAAVRLTQICVKYMLMHKQGSVINISSVVGLRGYKGLSVYSATKAGLDGFTRSLARELGGRGIRVNSIAPGFIDTDMTAELPPASLEKIIRRTPLKRLGKIEDITGLLSFLLSAKAEFITGQVFVVDGGITC
jgi:3-oxoacyl-[acyl-carrier protein] reductase